MFGNRDPHLALGYSPAKLCIRKKESTVNFTRINWIKQRPFRGRSSISLSRNIYIHYRKGCRYRELFELLLKRSSA